MNNRGNGIIVVLIGFVLIIAGIIVAIATATGFVNNVLQSDYISAMQGYVIGAIIAIILIVVGVVILIFGLRG
jgi:uncharacterized membrane protein YidH (DUF202 family)